MEFEKVNPLLIVAIVGIVLIEVALILAGEDGKFVTLVIATISYLAGVKTPDFLNKKVE